MNCEKTDDLGTGLNGMDVVQENLRSACVWKLHKSHQQLIQLIHTQPRDKIKQLKKKKKNRFIETLRQNESIWWDYENLWNKNCWQMGNQVSTFTASCSYQQMNQLNSTLSSWVQQCVTQSGGSSYQGGVNTILESETRLRETLGIYALPSIIVNSILVHGNIDCEEIDPQGCTVLSAICAGFVEGSDPQQCHYTPAPTVNYNCTSSNKDCRGICYGTWRKDKCGQCLPSDDESFDDCVGCDGVAFSGKKINPCGFCLQNNSSNFATYGRDCNDTCNGQHAIDSCGQCLSQSDPSWDSCVGCDGV
ncbi:hypothetical protein RFI_03944, partial [Reticulomyxa filosa]